MRSDGSEVRDVMEGYGAESWDEGMERKGGGRRRVPEALLLEISQDARNPRWAEVVAWYRPMMERYLSSHGAPESDWEDVIQETFSAVAEMLLRKSYRPGEKGAFENCLTGILKHKMFDAMRAANRRERTAQRFGELETAAGRLKLALDYDSCDGESGRAVRVFVTDGRDSVASREKRTRAICRGALRKLLADEGVSGRNREVFRRLWVRMESGEAVATALAMSRDAVYQVGSRMMRRLREMVWRMMEESARYAQ